MKHFGEIQTKPDVPAATDVPNADMEQPHESESWQNSIELPDHTDGSDDSSELTLDNDEWIDIITLGDFENSGLTDRIMETDDSVTQRTDADENDLPSTYKERIDRTPRDDGERGNWNGKRGESTFIPNNERIKATLDKYDMTGVKYTNGIPDFSQCSECTVEIADMTDKRYGKDGNFAQCDEKCAEKWNEEGRDGKTDWTARDVQKWREEHGFSWHERNDMKTCDLIPTEINDYFGHLGGVAECKKRDAAQNTGGDFDE